MNIYSDRIPYTYLVGWSKLGRYYYGVRYAKNCHPSDLWVTYFTSSKHVKALRDEYGEPDIIQIRKIFDNPHTAIIWEQKVLRRLNIFENQNIWINKNIAGAFDPKICGQYTKGTKRSKEAIQKAIETKKKNNKPNKNKGQKRPNISKALKGKPSPIKGKKLGPAPRERVEKMLESRKKYYEAGNSGPNKGKSMSDEQKLKISKTSTGHKKSKGHSEKLSKIAKTRYKIKKEDGTWTWGYKQA